MKHKSFYKKIFCLLLTFCLLAPAAGKLEVNAASASLESMMKQLKAGKYKKAAKISKKLPATAKEKCVKKMPAKMKKAYRNKVKSYRANPSSSSKKPFIWDYYLTDIDQDGSAELLIQSGTCEANVTLHVFKYSKNKLRKLGSFFCGHSSFYYYPDGILVYTAHMGGESVFLWSVKNGKLTSAKITERYSKTGPYQIKLPSALKSHQKHNSNYTFFWMDLKDLR